MKIIHVQEMGPRDTDVLGQVIYVRVYADDGSLLTWREAWDAYSKRYPDSWAIELFPPVSQIVDDTNVYHLFIVPAWRLTGLNINWGIE